MTQDSRKSSEIENVEEMGEKMQKGNDEITQREREIKSFTRCHEKKISYYNAPMMMMPNHRTAC